MTYIASLVDSPQTIIDGARTVLTLKDLYKVLLLRDTTDVHLTKEFIEEFFTPAGLADFIENVKALHPHIRIEAEQDVLDFQSKEVESLKSITTAEELSYLLMSKPKETMQIIKMLCDSYKNAYSETLLANNKVASLQLAVSKRQAEIEELESKIKRLEDSRNHLSASLSTIVNRINFKYNKELDESKLFYLKSNRYTKILYIKERTRIHYLDTFIYYLQEILKTLYTVPARVLVIEPYYAYAQINLYPNLKPHWSLDYKDVYGKDIMMAGFQPNLMEDILQNPSNVEYLIIVDRGCYKTPHVVGNNVDTFYTMSDLSDNYDNIISDRIISYSPTTHNIPYIEGFDSLSLEEKMSKYSSMPIMKYIIEAIERRG